MIRLLTVMLVIFSVATTATAFFGRHRAVVREQYSYSERVGMRPLARLAELRGAGCQGGFAATAPAPRAAGCQGGFAMPRTVIYPPVAPIPVPKASPAPATKETKTLDTPDPAVPDALDEVNALRARRGLRPFLRDPLLTLAARNTAVYRARYRLFGHTTNDFAFLPPGASAHAAGCAAYPTEYGWLSCAMYDDYTYAGASYEYGVDGKRYMHLFVRSGPASQGEILVQGTTTPQSPPPVAAPQVTPAAVFNDCPNGQCPVVGYSQPVRSGWRPGRILFGR